MLEIIGKYNTAKIFTDNADETTISQVEELLSQDFVEDSKIRIMPDCHAGVGCVIGTTMTIKDKVVPNLTGVDIGCGMRVIKVSNKNIDLEKLDNVIRENIPSGFAIRGSQHEYSNLIEFDEIIAECNKLRARNSIGTLGGGNHFIEVDKDNDGYFYVVIHTGSRNLGKQIAEYWQEVASKTLKDNYNQSVQNMILACIQAGRPDMIESSKKEIPPMPKDSLSYLFGKNFESYLSDMNIAQNFAVINRRAIGDVIVEKMGLDVIEEFTTIHNYIDMESRILRKGAVSSKLGEKLIIPINMRDGSIIAVGRGNEDWNFSAPHGAGRIMGRGQAKRSLSMEEYRETMRGIYSTSVNLSTLDESPMAYKNINEIINNTKETIDIQSIIKPVYNFKDSGD